MTTRDPRHAPDHLVNMIAATYPTRRSPLRSPDENHRAHLAQARLLADQIWAEAYTAGAAYMLATETPRYLVVDGDGQPVRFVGEGPW